jgi:hypothetical protein
MMIRHKDSIIANKNKVINIRRLICNMCIIHTMNTHTKKKERNNTTFKLKRDQTNYITRKSSHTKVVM